jgi:CHAT domain-containing protein
MIQRLSFILNSCDAKNRGGDPLKPCAVFALLFFALLVLTSPLFAQEQEPARLLHEADRLAWLNNWDKAGPLYERAETLFSQNGNARKMLVAKNGRVQASMQTRFFPDLSRELARDMKNPIIQSDPGLKLRWLVAKAEVDIEIDPPAAQRGWEEVRAIASRMGDKAWEARAQGKLGYIAFFQGDIYQTQELMREALLTAQSLGDVGAQIWYATTIGNGLGELGLHDQALRFLDEAFKIAESNPDAGFPYRALTGKARALAELKNRGEARKLLEQGLKELRAARRPLDESWFLIVLARLSAAENNLPLAIAYLETTRNLCIEGGFHHTLAWSMFELAKVYRDNGNLQRAEERANLAMTAMRQVQDKYHLPQHLALLAELVAKRGRFREADELLEQAADATEAMLANVPSTFSKTSLIATMSAIYVGHFVLAVEYLKDKPRAFEILERARGRAAADIIRSHSLKPPNPDEKTRALERQISQIQTSLQFTNLNNKNERNTLLDQLWRRKEELNSIPEPRTRFQELTIHSRPVTLEELRQVMRPDEVLLEYILSEPASYCIVITKKSFEILALAGRRKIEALVDSYLSEGRGLKPGNDEARHLYSLLLRPALSGQAQTKRLTIVPDGKLHLLPFDSLIDSKGRYVLETHTVSVAPSATVYHLLNTIQKTEEADLPFLGIGGVPYGQDAAAPPKQTSSLGSTRGLSELDFSRLPNLPGSGEEIEAVARIAGNQSVTLTGTSATKAAFVSQDISRYKVVHLAVHALSDTTFPDRSSLILWKDPNSDMDGLLQERDIRYLKLNADLVVLSACDIGMGRLQGQEGMVNLVRAFFYAGARTVVASLWETGDITTKILMTGFYSHLVAGKDKAEALRLAKLDILKKFGSTAPVFHWAGFLAFGEGGSAVQLQDERGSQRTAQIR